MGRFSNLEGNGDQDSPVESDISGLSQQPGRSSGMCHVTHKAMRNPICREQL